MGQPSSIQCLQDLKVASLARDNIFPVCKITKYFERFFKNVKKKIKPNIFLITQTINLQLDKISSKTAWHLELEIANQRFILNNVNYLGTGSGIDGKCTSPENVPECADYYADNPDVVKRPAVGQSDRPERVRTNRYY